MKKIAECHTCQVEAFVDNGPSILVPAPIYGAYGMKKHKGHDVRRSKEYRVANDAFKSIVIALHNDSN